MTLKILRRDQVEGTRLQMKWNSLQPLCKLSLRNFTKQFFRSNLPIPERCSLSNKSNPWPTRHWQSSPVGIKISRPCYRFFFFFSFFSSDIRIECDEGRLNGISEKNNGTAWRRIGRGCGQRIRAAKPFSAWLHRARSQRRHCDRT